jgi:mannose/fructose/N-acetylgalactosamine-specific phosphotransferase system component IIB
MPIVLLRVDDRLIHGQITTMWIGMTGAGRIVISSDEVAADPLQKTIVAITAPPQVPTQIMTNAQVVQTVKSGAWDHQKVLIICKYPGDALALVKGDIGVKEINIGNIGGMLQGKAAAGKQVSQSVAVTPDDIRVLREILAAGVKMQIRLTPRDRVEDMAAILAKL